MRLPRFRREREEITEARPVPAPGVPAKTPERAGFLNDIPAGGLNEYNAGVGAATQTDRRSLLRELYEAYLACPWAWACVTAISRTITAGGLVTDWDGDDSEGDQEVPDKPPEVLALERLINFCNPRHDIRQLLRNVIADLQVFGDAFVEVVWWGRVPVALYNLDCPTTTPLADEHGTITGYVQVTDTGLRAGFEPREVIHISLDAARPGVFGISPTQAVQLSITSWIFAAACGKEMLKKGLPPNVHVDLPQSMSEPETRRWRDKFLSGILGIKNLGTPLMTKGGGKVTELTTGKMADVIAAKSQSRDEIVAGYGVPPAKAGIIEAGNLGGGTGDAQDKTYRIDTCGPIAQLILEKLQFHLAVEGFGVKGWHLKFPEIDYRDSEIIEKIRDMRLRNGGWVLNRYRTEIGEPPVDGGDDPIFASQRFVVTWSDMAKLSNTTVSGGAIAPGAPGGPGAPPPPSDGAPDGQGQDHKDGKDGEQESLRVTQISAYRRRLAEALAAMPVTETADDAEQAVYAQLSKEFPPSAIAWVRDALSWEGPQRVPVTMVDTRDRGQWDATRPQDKPLIAKARAKLRKKLAREEQPKPLILVRWPGSQGDMIADGHHRFLAAEAEGQQFVWAYVGHVSSEKGPWLTMAASEEGRKAA